MEPLTIAGVMSGTSGDGIDVAVTTITPSPDDSQTPPGVELKGSATVPFAAETLALLFKLFSQEVTLKEVCELFTAEPQHCAAYARYADRWRGELDAGLGAGVD